MSKDQVLGAIILLGSIAVLGVYAILLYLGYTTLVFGIVITVAVFAVMGIVAWIGYTMATTPPPAPIESLDDVQSSSSETSDKSSEKSS